MMMNSKFRKLAAPIKLIIFDVDGVLTDAQVYFDGDSSLIKSFHTQDGLGMQLLLKTGVDIGIITSHQSPAVTARMNQLGIQHVYQGHSNKIPAYEELLTQLHLKDFQVAYMGDDVTDLRLIRRAGLGISVPNAHEIVKKYARYITRQRGGYGAVREVCDLLMKVQNTYESVYHAYL